MATLARFDLKMDADDKDIVARAAAKEKALALLERESHVRLSKRDFAAFAKALDGAFTPNRALKGALSQANTRVRRA